MKFHQNFDLHIDSFEDDYTSNIMIYFQLLIIFLLFNILCFESFYYTKFLSALIIKVKFTL